MNRVMGAVADYFGKVSFIIGFNVLTVLWILSGMKFPKFIDHWPYNFFTFAVSWLAINMTSFVLFKDNRNAEREASAKETQRKQLEALVRATEESTLTNELVQQIARNQVHLMDAMLKRKEG